MIILLAFNLFATDLSSNFKADWSNELWTKYVSDAIDTHGKRLLTTEPMDAKTYGFEKAKAKQFYIMFLSSMTRYESSFNPDASMYECNRKKCIYSRCKYVQGRGYCMLGGHELDGGLIVSRGLLQLSLQSAQAYGCEVYKPEDLHDPQKNLICSVKILNNWVHRDQTIGTDRKGGARYWSVLRESSPHRAKIIRNVRN